MPRIICLFLSVILALPLCAAGGGGTVHDPVATERLEDLLAPLSSLSADFTQTVTDGDGFELQSVSGAMTVARPGKVHWQSDPPYEQLVVSDARTLWLYDRDLEQVTVRPFDNNIANTPAVLFIGETDRLAEDYAVSSVNEGKDRIFTLVPRDEAAVYERISVTFKEATPAAMSLWDSLGQRTEISFENVVVNPAVPPAVFTFTIPEGVDVLSED